MTVSWRSSTSKVPRWDSRSSASPACAQARRWRFPFPLSMPDKFSLKHRHMGDDRSMERMPERYLVDENGNRIAVVLPMKEYQQLLEALEELEEIRAFDEAIASG